MSWARRGTVDAEQLLDRQRVGVLLVHRRDVVEPVEIGHVLQIGARLHQLLGAAMQQADMRIDALDHLAVELQHQPQHAVRRRMLRPEIDREVAEGMFGHGRAPDAARQGSRQWAVGSRTAKQAACQASAVICRFRIEAEQHLADDFAAREKRLGRLEAGENFNRWHNIK